MRESGKPVFKFYLVVATVASFVLLMRPANADVITDWNLNVIKAAKGFNGVTGTGAVLGSNVRVQAEAHWDFSHDRIREVAYSGLGRPAPRSFIDASPAACNSFTRTGWTR